MKYCQRTTLSHPLSIRFPQHIENINAIIKREGGSYLPFNNEIALNLDMVKKNSGNKHIEAMKSMDIVLGIVDEHNTVSSLLVDFKLNCNGTRSLKDGDCKDKIKHSKILLFGSGVSVQCKYIFIFNDNLLNESRSILIRVLNNPSAEILSVKELKTAYF